MKFNKLVPELAVSDYKNSMKFYTKILGFKIEYKRVNFAFLSFEGSQIMIIDKGRNKDWICGKMEKPFGRGINFQIEIKNLDKLLSALKKNKYPIFVGPEENWYKCGKKLIGGKEILIKDPDGYILRFSQDIKNKKIG